ncbi:MAG: AMP-binding protein [Deltaproteobacteria bacterium]|nr:AMP-binding protein [Deltaproteobacteria bacterium]NIS77585.1 AMP-binding protein [Deltaproteobacteria bacterium]
MGYETLSRMFLDRLESRKNEVKFRYKRDNSWVDMTCAQAGKIIRLLSAGLYSLGLEKGDKVSILSYTRVEWTLADAACIVGGFVTVPIYHSLLPDTVEYILGDCKAKAIFVEDAKQMMKVNAIRESVPDLKWIVSMTPIEADLMKPSDVISFNELQKMGEEAQNRDPDFIDRVAGEIKPEDDLTVIYTSGTTGPPKGVVTTQENFWFMVNCSIRATEIREGEIMLHFLPFAHTLGRIEQFISFDANLVSAYAESMEAVGDNMAEVKPHIMVSVPRLYEKFYDRVMEMVEKGSPLKKKIFRFALETGIEVSRLRQQKKSIPFLLGVRFAVAKKLVFDKIKERIGGRLRFFISGGAPLAKEIAEFFHAMDVLILEGYGLTECSTVASVNRLDNFKFGTVGLPLPDVQIKIVEDGEILIGGKNIFKEYLNDPGGTRNAKTEDGWLKTGDIGEIDEDGFLTITDRKKDILVTASGKNIPPANIENLLKMDNFVSQSFIYGDRKKFLVALMTLNREEIEAWAREQGIQYDSYEDLATGREVNDLIQKSVDKVNAKLASFETVKRFLILPDDFSQETGELTPTLKVKRKVVVEKYGRLLDSLYED